MAEMGRTKPKCCRKLFDAEGDPGEIPEIQNFIAEDRQRSRERWNFDFENDVPLEGRYEWVRVAPPSPPAPSNGPKGGGGPGRPGAAEKTKKCPPKVKVEEGVVKEEEESEEVVGQDFQDAMMDAVEPEAGREMPPSATNSEQARD